MESLVKSNLKSQLDKQAKKQSLKYFGKEKLPTDVFCKKYLLRDNDDMPLEFTPDDMHKRIAGELARIENGKFKEPLSFDTIYSYLKNFKKIIPQGSPMFGIGNPYQYVTISNCYVGHPPLDNYGGIHKTDQELTQISKRRGGFGLDISNIRPRGSLVRNSSKSATGILPFMERYSNSIREVGQCIEGNQRVITEQGIKNIKDVKPSDKVWTKIGWINVRSVFNNGVKDVYRVTTNAGYSIVTSLDHIYQSFDENGNLLEVRLSNLNVGDNIVLCVGDGSYNNKSSELIRSEYKNTNNKPDNCELPTFIDEDLAYLIGYSYGDGYVSKTECGNNGLHLACSNDYEEIKTKLRNICFLKFKYLPTVTDGDGDLENININNKTIVQFLSYNGLLKQKSEEITFPERIMLANPDIQISFLSGYFDADGDIACKKGGYRFRSVSKQFLQNTQVILSSLGVASKLSSEDRSDRGWNTLYTLGIVGKQSTKRFKQLFVHSEKVKSKPYNAYSYCPDNAQYLSLSTVNRLKIENESVCDNLLQDKIALIEYVGQEETYDLELDAEHLFWCEGLYVHNSGRRGALMITIDIRHPESVILSDDKTEDIVVNPNMEHLGIPPIKTTTDIYNPKHLDFCSVKLDRTKITGANISIRFCDEFFQAVKNGTTFKQQWPIDSDNPSIVKEVDARKIWAKIVKCAWLSAEPGILFWDNILKESPADCYSRFGFKTISTNPCSEIPLSILDSCRLLLKNLLAYVKNAFLSNAYFDYEEFFEGAVIAQRLMDDIVDLELEKIDAILTKIKNDPEPEEIKRDELELWENIRRACEDGRRTGTGLTGLADAMAALGIGYGTDKSIEFADEVYKVFKFACYKSSIDMAKEVGPFKIWSHELEKNNPFFERIKQERVYWENPETGKVLYIKGEDLYDDMAKHGRRNIALLTSAPAGSSSIVAWAGHELETHVVNKFYRNFYGTSSGIEPVWNVAMTRRRKVNSEEKSVKIDFKDANGDCWEEYYVYHPTVKYWMAQTKESDVTKSPWYGYTSDKINWTNRVVLQSTAQKHIDHAISSTINLPNDVSPELVGEIYETAWQYGCKGMTVYRDGCRTGVLLDKTEIADKIQKTTAIKRPKSLPCDIYHITVNKQLFLVVVGLLDNEPYEVLAAKTDKIDKRVKTGHIIRVTRGVYKLIAENGEVIESVTELCEDAEEAITRLVSTSLRHGAEISFIVHQLEKTKGNLMSFSKCLARALKKYIKNGSHISGEECNICKGRLIREGGCKICTSCGNSSCS